MRHVFPTSEIPHKWAHQTQDSARNPQGNLYFRGDTLYSYRDSYPIAKLFRKKGRGTLALHVENTYSATTAGHCSAARRACSHLLSITVPDVEPDNKYRHSPAQHAQNIAWLVKQAAEYLEKAQRALQVSNVAWRRTAAEERLKDARDYCAFFGIRRKVPAFPEIAWNAATARAERIENPDPRSKDARERASAKRRERKLFLDNLHGMAGCTDWRLGGPWHAYSRYARGPIMLRINGEQIETSAGARIPLAAAPMVWARVQRALGVGYKPAGLSAVKIGDYPLTEIRPDGTLVAGCHEIPHSELRAMARALGLAAV